MNKNFFLTSFILSYGILILWFVMSVFAKDLVYGMHRKCFDIPKADMDKIHYFLMGLLKILAIIFFLIPYLSMQMNS